MLHAATTKTQAFVHITFQVCKLLGIFNYRRIPVRWRVITSLSSDARRFTYKAYCLLA